MYGVCFTQEFTVRDLDHQTVGSKVGHVFSTVICTGLLMRLLYFHNKTLAHQKTPFTSY